MNKNILLSIAASLVLLATFTSCDEERTLYAGPEYIMFADTLTVLGVENSDEVFDIAIAATTISDKDRTIAVEIVDKHSNAIEGIHYTLESNTVTIKAGEMVGNLRMKGIAENLTVDYDPEVMLHLIADEKYHWDLYNGDTTRVVLRKICPFDINAFSGYAMITSTFLYNYTGSYNRLIKTEVDPTEENTIILRNFYYDGYDVKLRFTTDDPLNPLIEMDDQPLVSTGEAFGTIYGDGMLHIYQPTNYISYYSSCEKFIYQYITLWVPGMAAGTNTVGTFIQAIEWISDDEARILMNQGF
ncbi:MAG: DUF4984 domain-containing protein [Bacteroidaceae bacterium]|nr:DUF4984 domain-containing protein [Bacteroidaceae bacterium]